MEIDWTTFALEIVNFLVLVWILKRYLYKPVLATIAARKAGIERLLAEAHATETHATALESQFEGRLADWEAEKAAARSRLDAELARERERQMEALAEALDAERERNAAQESHRQETLKRELSAEAGAEARHFAAELLRKVAGRETEARLVDLFVEELMALPEERLGALRAGQNGRAHGVFATAYPLPEALRTRLVAAVEARLGTRGDFEFVEDSALVAGVRLSLGAWQLDFSVAGELRVFEEIGTLGR